MNCTVCCEEMDAPNEREARSAMCDACYQRHLEGNYEDWPSQRWDA